MSQLNNDKKEDKFENKKTIKNHSTRNMIIFLILFTMICVGVTIFLILKSNNAKGIQDITNIVSETINKDSENVISDDGLGLQSLNETYKKNNLKIKKVKFTDGNKNSEGVYQLEGNYIEIDGLKDKEIQQKINENIKNKITTWYTQEDLKGTVQIDTNCTANFANVLSIEAYKNSSNNTNVNYIGINIDLSTGNEIKFKELFTQNAGIKNILSKSVYDSLITDATAGEDADSISDEPDFSKNGQDDTFYDENSTNKKEREQKYSEIEDKVFKILSYYNSGNELEFSFSPRCIYVYKENTRIQINMKKYYNQIAIYNKFKTNSDIYDGRYESEYILKNDNIPVFTPSNDLNVTPDIIKEPVVVKYVNIIKVSDNLLCNIIVTQNSLVEEDSQDSEIYLTKIKDIVNEKIEQYKNSNDNKARYLQMDIQMGDFEGTYTIVGDISEYSVESDYKEEFYNNIIDKMQDGIYRTWWIPEDKDDYGYIWKNTSMNYKDISYNNSYESYEYNKNNKKWIKEDSNNQEENIQNQNENQNNKKEENQTQGDEQNENVSNNQGNGKVIVIDPGHQAKGNSEKEPIGPGATQTKAKVTTGATGVATGQTEALLNLKVATLLQQELTKKGYTVIMTRTTNNVDISNSERAQIANKANADAFIRIHANSADNSSAKGVLTMCQTAQNKYNGNIADKSYKLSKLIVDNIAKTTGTNNKGVTRTDDMSGINWCQVPSTIVEMGFLSNTEEDKLLADESYQKKIVNGIVIGLEEYLAN